MTTFDERGKGQESKFAHDQELAFRITARRNKLLGQWVAAKIGLTGAAAESYAQEVVASDFVEAGEEDVYRKVAADLAKHKVDLSEHRIRREMAELHETARQQIQKG